MRETKHSPRSLLRLAYVFCMLMFGPVLARAGGIAEQFASADNDLDNLSVLFTPDGSPNGYAAQVDIAYAYHTDPTGSTPLAMGDDSSTSIALGQGSIPLFGVNYSAVYISSNGYLTFSGSDNTYIESYVTHFASPRVAALFRDLHPGQGGTVSYLELPDRFVVTWENVPEINSGNQNSFQIELYRAGPIRLTWLNLDSTAGLAGLSDGLGQSPTFSPTDISNAQQGDFSCSYPLVIDSLPFIRNGIPAQSPFYTANYYVDHPTLTPPGNENLVLQLPDLNSTGVLRVTAWAADQAPDLTILHYPPGDNFTPGELLAYDLAEPGKTTTTLSIDQSTTECRLLVTPNGTAPIHLRVEEIARLLGDNPAQPIPVPAPPFSSPIYDLGLFTDSGRAVPNSLQDVSAYGDFLSPCYASDEIHPLPSADVILQIPPMQPGQTLRIRRTGSATVNGELVLNNQYRATLNDSLDIGTTTTQQLIYLYDRYGQASDAGIQLDLVGADCANPYVVPSLPYATSNIVPNTSPGNLNPPVGLPNGSETYWALPELTSGSVVRVSTEGSSRVSSIGIYSGSCGSLQPVAFAQPGKTALQFTPAFGQTYYIVLDAPYLATDRIALTVTEELPGWAVPLQTYGLGNLEHVEFSPDGRYMATTGLQTSIWKLDTFDLLRQLPGGSSLRFTTDSQQIFIGGLGVFDIASGDLVRSLPFTTISPNFKYGVNIQMDRFIAGSDQNVIIFDARNGLKLYSIDLVDALNQITGGFYLTNAPTAYNFSEDGERLIVGCVGNYGRASLSHYQDASISVWDLATGRNLKYIQPQYATVNGGPGVTFVAELFDQYLYDYVYEYEDPPFYERSQHFVYENNLEWSESEVVGFSEKARLIALKQNISGDPYNPVYQTSLFRITPSSLDPIPLPPNLDAPKAIDHTGTMIFQDSSLYSLASGALINKFIGYDFSYNGIPEYNAPRDRVQLQSFNSFSGFTQWDFDSSSGRFVSATTGTTTTAPLRAYSADRQRMAVTASGGVINVYNLPGQALLNTLPSTGDPNIKFMAFAANADQLVVVRGNNIIERWNVLTSAWINLQDLVHPFGEAIAAAIDHTRSLLFTSNDHFPGAELRAWNIAAGSVQQYNFIADDHGYIPEFINGGDATAAYYEQGMSIARWDLGTNLLTSIISCSTRPWSSAISPDNQLLAYGTGDQLWLYKIPSGELLHKYPTRAESRELRFETINASPVLLAYGSSQVRAYELDPPRALIIAGGGFYPANAIGAQTKALGNYAYDTLRKRGYLAKDILYLSAFGEGDADGDGVNDVDAPATLENIKSALVAAGGVFQNDGSGTVWRARDGGRLTVFMLDHGYKTESFMAFRVNETQLLDASQFATWMNDLQTSSPNLNLQLVIDCCFSGAFIDPLRNAFPNRRVLVASTADTEEAMFVPPPDLTSFMYGFLSSAYMGNSFGEAWRSTQRFFRAFPVSEQIPRIWDGSSVNAIEDSDTTLSAADRTFFGRSWAYGVQSRKDVNQFFPAFDEADPIKIIPLSNPLLDPPVVNPGEKFRIEARLDLFQRTPSFVTVAVRPPAPTVVAGEPVTALPRVELSLAEPRTALAGELWTATIDTATTPTFQKEGQYLLSVTARFTDTAQVSNPEFEPLIISGGITTDTVPIRAVIAVGQGPNATTNDTMRQLGKQSYQVSLDRFRDNKDKNPNPDWIEYFTPLAERDHPQSDDALLTQTLSGLHFNDDATTPIGRLYVHLIGPATQDSDTPGTEALVLSGNGVSTTSLDVLQLDRALDAFQARPLGFGVTKREVIVVLDMPFSGKWLSALAAPNRIVFTSARPSDPGLYVPGSERTGSFSGRFMLAAAQGSDLRDSFRAAQNFFRGFTSQAPLYDDNGDGLFGNELWNWRWSSLYGDPQYQGVQQDGAYAKTRWWGRQYAFAGDGSGLVPFVLNINPTSQTLNSGQTGHVRATLIEGVSPVDVKLRLLPPASARAGTATGLLEQAMTTGTVANNQVWDANFTAPTLPGEWRISVVARYADGATLRDSEPATATLTMLGGPPQDVYEWLWTEDAQSPNANPVAINYEEFHNFDGPDDEDWYQFIAVAGAPFTIIADSQDPDCNVVLDVYLPNQSPRLVNDGLDGASEYEIFTLPLNTSGLVYFRVRNGIRGGYETGYRIYVNKGTGPNSGVPTVGSKRANFGSGGGSIPGNAPPPEAFKAEYTVAARALNLPLTEYYDRVQFTFPSNALAIDSDIVLSGFFAPNLPTDKTLYPGATIRFGKAGETWREQSYREFNFTPLNLSIDPMPAGNRLNQPLQVRMQMLNGTSIVYPNQTTTPETAQDIPAGRSARQAEIWMWVPSSSFYNDVFENQQGTWQVIASPGFADTPMTVSGNEVTAVIPPSRLAFADRDSAGDLILAVAPTYGGSAVESWAVYE